MDSIAGTRAPHGPELDEYMTYASHMKRTTIFLPDHLRIRLEVAAKRQGRPQAELVREALTEYLEKDEPPWPSFIGAFTTKPEFADDGYDSSNIKDWLRSEYELAARLGYYKPSRITDEDRRRVAEEDARKRADQAGE